MVPGTLHHVIVLARLRCFPRRENTPWPRKVLLIEPTPDVQVGHLHGANDALYRLSLPEIVIVGMRDKVVPGGPLAVEITRVGLAEGPQLEIPVVSIELLELESLVGFPGLHHGGIFEAVAQPEGAVMVKIVAQEQVGWRG